jgi:hypothetical protein
MIRHAVVLVLFSRSVWRLHPGGQTACRLGRAGSTETETIVAGGIPPFPKPSQTVNYINRLCVIIGAPYGSRTRLFRLKSRIKSGVFKAHSNSSSPVHGMVLQRLALSVGMAGTGTVPAGPRASRLRLLQVENS